jgi:hypothetical protein
MGCRSYPARDLRVNGLSLAVPVDQTEPCGAAGIPVFTESAAWGARLRLIGLFHAAVVAFFSDEFESGQKKFMKAAPKGKEVAS